MTDNQKEGTALLLEVAGQAARAEKLAKDNGNNYRDCWQREQKDHAETKAELEKLKEKMSAAQLIGYPLIPTKGAFFTHDTTGVVYIVESRLVNNASDEIQITMTQKHH